MGPVLASGDAVAPGTIATSGLDKYPQMIQGRFKAQEEQNLMQRFGTAEDNANLFCF